MTSRVRGGLIAVVVAAAVGAVPATPIPATAESKAAAPGLAYTAKGCVEPSALVTIPRVVLEGRLDLPDPFRLRDFAPGVAAVVVAVASCESVSVGGKHAASGRFSDVGVLIESPDGSAGAHFYQLWQVSDHQDLVALMAKVGMATDTATISFEKSPVSAVGTVHSRVSNYKLSVFTPPPESGTGTGRNTWWHDGSHGVVRVQNEGTGVAENFGPYVLELAEGSALAQILGSTVLTGVGATVYIGEHRGQTSIRQL